jgi:hypothetical protein
LVRPASRAGQDEARKTRHEGADTLGASTARLARDLLANITGPETTARSVHRVDSAQLAAQQMYLGAINFLESAG